MQRARLAGLLTLLVVVVPTTTVAEATDDRPTLALILSEFEYQSDTTVPPFAEENFSEDFRIVSAVNADEHSHDLPDVEVLREADVAIFSIWRRALPPEQLAVIKEYIASGKPVIALRTCSHAFHTRESNTPEGRATWPTFDRDVLGGFYQGHHGNYAHEGGPKTHVWTVPGTEDHPLLTGIEAGEFIVPSWLYKMQPLSDKAQPLLMGRVEDRVPHEPVAWTIENEHGGQVFFTSLGSPEDFDLPQFQYLLRNAVYWAADLAVPQGALDH